MIPEAADGQISDPSCDTENIRDHCAKNGRAGVRGRGEDGVRMLTRKQGAGGPMI